MTIRNMTIADYEDIYRLWIHTPGMGLNTTDDSRAGIEAYLRRNPNTCFVAVSDGTIVGVILAGHDGRRGFLHHTAVHPAVRRRGIAKRLVQSALDALAREGIHKVSLVVFSQNEDGNAFWESIGFTKREDLTYRNQALTELISIRT